MFEKEKKYFPKITDPQCQLKWNWSTIWADEGTTNSCHRCLRVPLDPKNFGNFHNLPHKIKEREIMLSGKWPTIENGGSGHCNFCKRVEDVGGISDRIGMFSVPNLVPKELFKNNHATNVTPKILEVFLNNKCNLKCTYCGPRLSSQWQSETKKYGPFKIESKDFYSWNKLKTLSKEKSRFWFNKTLEWIEQNGNELAILNLLGGETFYQSELQEVLDTLKKVKNRNLLLSITSNLMIKENRFKNYLDQIKGLCKNKNIGRFNLTASIDGWGEEAEYARSGLRCDHFEKLFLYAVNEKWIGLNTNSTVSVLTVKSLPLLLEKVKLYRKINKKINIRFGFVTGKNHLHPEIYGNIFWQEDIKKIIESMPCDTNMDKIISDSLVGAFNSITNKEPNHKMIAIFKSFLDQLDQRRNTNWRKVFPYLDI